MRTYRYGTEVVLPAALAEVFSFFAKAENLEKRVENQVDRLSRELSLSDTQREKIQPILLDAARQATIITTNLDYDKWYDLFAAKALVDALLDVLADDPLKSPPPFEKLVGDLSGAYSRRNNIQHRIVYQVLEEARIVKIIRMWTHYE